MSDIPPGLDADQWMRAKAVELVFTAQQQLVQDSNLRVKALLRTQVCDVYHYIKNGTVPVR